MNIELLKRRICEVYDPDYLVDVLEITSEELLNAFEAYLLAAVDAGEFPHMGED